VVGSLFYSLLRVLLDALATKYSGQVELQVEVLGLSLALTLERRRKAEAAP
jgi:hypothetical protein